MSPSGNRLTYVFSLLLFGTGTNSTTIRDRPPKCSADRGGPKDQATLASLSEKPGPSRISARIKRAGDSLFPGHKPWLGSRGLGIQETKTVVQACTSIDGQLLTSLRQGCGRLALRSAARSFRASSEPVLPPLLRRPISTLRACSPTNRAGIEVRRGDRQHLPLVVSSRRLRHVPV